jgi:MazG family protein
MAARMKRSGAGRSSATARARRRAAARAGAAFARLVRVMADLRSPRGCAWDRRQSHATLRPYLLEETYEALDAIDRRDPEALKGELGDVLFQVVFHAEIAGAGGRFDAANLVADVTAKLIRRHPHVFTAAGRLLRRRSARTPAAVIEQWERIKAREQRDAGRATGLLTGIPRALPALLAAHKIGKRAAAVGFDWPRAEAVMDKIDEEARELRTALGRSRAESVDEMGDLLFSIANLARKLGIEPEAALRQANSKFTRRFEAVERLLAARGRHVHDATLDELEQAWADIKRPAPAREPSTAGRSSTGRTSRSRPSRRRPRRRRPS